MISKLCISLIFYEETTTKLKLVITSLSPVYSYTSITYSPYCSSRVGVKVIPTPLTTPKERSSSV